VSTIEGPAGASGGGAAQARPGPHRGAANGVWGMALFMAAEVALFGTLLGSYFYLNTVDRHWPPAGIQPPRVLLPLLVTGLLLATLLPVNLAVRASRRGEGRRTVVALCAALALQSGYLACQILLLIHDLGQFSPQGSAYGSIYFTLLVVHHAHVAFGLALELMVIAMVATKGLTRYWRIAVRNVGIYWNVVGALAVVVVLTQLSPSL